MNADLTIDCNVFTVTASGSLVIAGDTRTPAQILLLLDGELLRQSRYSAIVADIRGWRLRAIYENGNCVITEMKSVQENAECIGYRTVTLETFQYLLCTLL